MAITKIKQLKIGMTVYKVHAFGTKSKAFVTEHTVVGFTENKSSFLTREDDPRFSFNPCQESLRDANVIANTYNCHRLFKSKEAAERYARTPSMHYPRLFTRKDGFDKYLKGKHR